jgi:4-hydroxybenzoate polyprenyltransferase
MTFVGVLCFLIIVVALVLNKYFLDYDRLYILGIGIFLSIVILAYPAYVKRIKHYGAIVGILIVAMGFYILSRVYF